jgi:2,4-dienoyl-CoA reductase-like NADH-dependent reductase (Old Yellow Enzyme family)
MGNLELRNRIVMAPLTRMRANNPGHAPTELHAEYYAQRASSGLIIGECSEVSRDGYGGLILPDFGAENKYGSGDRLPMPFIAEVV